MTTVIHCQNYRLSLIFHKGVKKLERLDLISRQETHSDIDYQIGWDMGAVLVDGWPFYVHSWSWPLSPSWLHEYTSRVTLCHRHLISGSYFTRLQMKGWIKSSVRNPTGTFIIRQTGTWKSFYWRGGYSLLRGLRHQVVNDSRDGVEGVDGRDPSAKKWKMKSAPWTAPVGERKPPATAVLVWFMCTLWQG